jgi:hypothetical protein
VCHEIDEEKMNNAEQTIEHFMNNNVISNEDKSKEKSFFRVECNCPVLQMLTVQFYRC